MNVSEKGSHQINFLRKKKPSWIDLEHLSHATDFANK